MAKVVLIVAAVVAAPLFRLPDQGGHRPGPDRRLLRHRDHAGGQLAGPRAASPAGSRSCSSTCRSAASIFGIGLLIVPPLVNGVDGPLRRPARLRRRPATQQDLPRATTTATTSPRSSPSRPTSSRASSATPPARCETSPSGVFNRFVQLFSILVITFFLVKDGHRLLDFLYRQLPPESARRLRKIADDISDAIAGYVFGNFVISILAGLVTYVTLTILDVPFAVPLAILFGFFDLIPLVGATLGGILVGSSSRSSTSRRADRLGRGADPLPADREQPDPAVRLRPGRCSSIP